MLVVGMLVSASEGQAQHHFSTPADTIPNFANSPTIVSVANGSWTSTSTWSPARVPLSTDIVLIEHDVTYNSLTGVADVIGIANGASLTFVTNTSTSLKVGVLMVLPGGTLEIGSSTTPIDAGATAEIVIANRALDPVGDVNQWGTGIIAIDGTVRMHGAPKTTFVRVAAEPLDGHTTIQLSESVSGWEVDDEVFLPDTRQIGQDDKFNSNYQLQVETILLQSVALDGNSVTVPSLQSLWTH